MKCKTCQTTVPPVFAQALLDNSCPACGKEILGKQGFKEMLEMRKQLAILDLDSRTTTTIAAALSEKFDLIVKGSRDGYGELVVQAAVEEEIEEEEQADIEAELRERALREAKRQRGQQIVAEWGLNNGQQFVNKKGAKAKIQEEFEDFDEAEEEEEELDLEQPPIFAGSGGTKAAERAARLAAAEQMRNSGVFRVQRKE